VWHVVWRDDPDEVTVKEAELEAYLDEINFAYPTLKTEPSRYLSLDGWLGFVW
jgi:hypothetical protein